MPTTRTELPWNKIQSEFESAIIKYLSDPAIIPSNYINCRYITEVIDADPSSYPEISSNASFRGINSRCTMVCHKMGWSQWTNSARGVSKGMKFAVPARIMERVYRIRAEERILAAERISKETGLNVVSVQD